MFERINDDRCKVLGEFWTFLLAVLNDVVGQVKEGQLAWYLSCMHSNRKTHIIVRHLLMIYKTEF